MADPRKSWMRVLDRDELIHLAVELKKAKNLAEEMKPDIHGTRLTDLRLHDLRRTMRKLAGGSGCQSSVDSEVPWPKDRRSSQDLRPPRPGPDARLSK